MANAQQSMFAPPPPLLCWLWLAQLLGPGSAAAGRILAAFGDAQQAYAASATPAFAAAAGRAAAARLGQPQCSLQAMQQRLALCEQAGIQVLTPQSAHWPALPAAMEDMPLVLFCTGDPAHLRAPHTVGVVGSRLPTPYGVNAAAAIGRGLAQNGAAIVSGLATGLDSEAHRAALAAGAPTIGVLGVPIDQTYPAANGQLRSRIEQCGCVVSEYPPASRAIGKNGFLQRNRLIAALGRALLVVEAKQRSGTMSTVHCAARYGRPVFAVPGSIFSEGCSGTNLLIRTHAAQAAVCPADLFEALGIAAPIEPAGAAAPPPKAAPAPPALSGLQQQVLACIGPLPQGVEALAARTGLPAPALLGALMQLELAGQVEVLPGRQYKLP